MEKWQDPKIIGLWIAIAIVLVFTILLFVVKIMHAGYKRMTEANLREARIQLEHQKTLLDTSLHAQERERGRIAADLHDGLIGRLTLIRMKNQIGAGQPELDALLAESITDARRISHDLTPPLLEFLSLQELVEQVVSPWDKKFAISFYTDLRIEATPSAEFKIQLLRVVQELVTNIIKHAQATTITVHFRHTPQKLILQVKDNGNGFDASQQKKGLGMQSLELRMQYFNAAYRVKPGSNGTAALIIIPV
jgi:signal transduction histidine kinase